jgi:uncharacterized Zn-binding protein involved in type VI secretion
MKKHCIAACSLVLVFYVCIVGCGRRGDTVEITGTVVFDGQPLPKGNIMFLPVGGKGPTAATTIADGKYTLRIALGTKQVQIQGFKVTGQRHVISNDPSSKTVDVLTQYLPERYNTKSELTCKIIPAMYTYDFAL